MREYYHKKEARQRGKGENAKRRFWRVAVDPIVGIWD